MNDLRESRNDFICDCFLAVVFLRVAGVVFVATERAGDFFTVADFTAVVLAAGFFAAGFFAAGFFATGFFVAAGFFAVAIDALC